MKMNQRFFVHLIQESPLYVMKQLEHINFRSVKYITWQYCYYSILALVSYSFSLLLFGGGIAFSSMPYAPYLVLVIGL